MRRLASLTLLAVAVAVAGCSQFSVRTERDPSENFAALRTFAWLTSRPASAMRSDPTFAPWGTGWWTGWGGGSAVYSDDYDSGTLFIAAMDAKHRQVIWLGAAEARLLPHISLDRRLDRVDDAVAAILKTFPAR